MEKKELITSWSYSRLQTWLQCPYKAKLLMIDKLQEPSNRYMERGKEIHKKLENYMLASNARGFKEMGPYRAYLQNMKKSKKDAEIFIPEMQVAFNKDLEQVDWFAKDAWLRAIFDLYVKYDNKNATIIDYKTGRRNNTHVEQADMYAALFYLLNKDTFLEKGLLTVQFAYVDDNVLENMLEKTYNLSTCKKHLKRFLKLGEAMTKPQDFKQKFSDKCKYCHFRKANNGPCKY